MATGVPLVIYEESERGPRTLRAHCWVTDDGLDIQGAGLAFLPYEEIEEVKPERLRGKKNVAYLKLKDRVWHMVVAQPSWFGLRSGYDRAASETLEEEIRRQVRKRRQ